MDIPIFSAPTEFETSHRFDFFSIQNPPTSCEIRNNKLFLFQQNKEKQVPLSINELFSIIKYLHGDDHQKIAFLQKTFKKNYYIEDDLEKIMHSFLLLCDNIGCKSYCKGLTNNNNKKRKPDEAGILVKFEKQPEASPIKKVNAISNYDGDCCETKEIYTHFDLFQLIGPGPHFNRYYQYISSIGNSTPLYPHAIIIDEQSAVSLLYDAKNSIQTTIEMLSRGKLNERAIDFCLLKGIFLFEENKKQTNKNFICLSTNTYREIYYYFNSCCNIELTSDTKNIFRNKDGSLNELIIFPISLNNHISLVAVYSSVCKNTNKIKIDLCLHIDSIENSSHSYSEPNPKLFCISECCRMLMFVERNCYYKKNVNWGLIKKFLIVQLMIENNENVEFIDFSRNQSSNILRLRDFTIANVVLQADKDQSNDCGSIFVRNYNLLLHSFYNTSNSIIISIMDALRENYKTAKFKFTYFQNDYINLANEIYAAVNKFCFIQEKIKNENLLAGLCSDLKFEGFGFPDNVEFEFSLRNNRTNTNYSWYMQSSSFILSINSKFDFELGNIKKARLVDNNIKDGGSSFSNNILFYFNRSDNKLYFTIADVYSENYCNPNEQAILIDDYIFIIHVNKNFKNIKTYSTFKNFYDKFHESVEQLKKNNSTQSLQIFTCGIFNSNDSPTEFIIDINTSNHSNLFQISEPYDANVCYTNLSHMLTLAQWKYIASEVYKNHKKDAESFKKEFYKSPFKIPGISNQTSSTSFFTPMPIETRNDVNNNNNINDSIINENLNLKNNSVQQNKEKEILISRINELSQEKDTLTNQIKELTTQYNDIYRKNMSYKNRITTLNNNLTTQEKGEEIKENVLRAAKNDLIEVTKENDALKNQIRKLNESFNDAVSSLTIANEILRKNNLTNNFSKNNLNIENCQFFISLIIKSISENIKTFEKIFQGDENIKSQCQIFMSDLKYVLNSIGTLKSTITSKLKYSGLKYNDDEIDYLNNFLSLYSNNNISPNFSKLNKSLLNLPNSQAIVTEQVPNQNHIETVVNSTQSSETDPIKKPSPVFQNYNILIDTTMNHFLLFVEVDVDVTFYITTLELATFFPNNYKFIYPGCETLLENIEEMILFSANSIKYYSNLLKDYPKNETLDLSKDLLSPSYKNYPFLKPAELIRLAQNMDNKTCLVLFEKALDRAKYFEFAFNTLKKGEIKMIKATCLLCNQDIVGDNMNYKCNKRNCRNIVCHTCFENNLNNFKSTFLSMSQCNQCTEKSISGKECAVCNNTNNLKMCQEETVIGSLPCRLNICPDCSSKCPNVSHLKTKTS